MEVAIGEDGTRKSPAKDSPESSGIAIAGYASNQVAPESPKLIWDDRDRPAEVSLLEDQPAFDDVLTNFEIQAEALVEGGIDRMVPVETWKGRRWLIELNPKGESSLANLYYRDKGRCNAIGIYCRSEKQQNGNKGYYYKWYHRLPLHEQQRIAAARGELTSLPVHLSNPTPPISAPADHAYFPYQVEGVKFLLTHPRALLADEMGLGKTIQVIGLINALPVAQTKKILIVCPNRVKQNWVRELNAWLVLPRNIYLHTRGKFTGAAAEIVVINYEMMPRLYRELQSIPWDIRVVDEAHYCKEYKAQRTKATLSIPAVRCIHLTGTPILNRPRELFSLLSDLSPHLFPGYIEYSEEFCDGKLDDSGHWNDRGASNLEQLQEILCHHLMLRREKRMVLHELPEKIRKLLFLEKPARLDDRTVRESVQAVQQAKIKFAKEVNGTKAYQLAAKELECARQMAFKAVSHWRQVCGKAKAPEVIAHVKQLLEEEEGRKILVFAYHREVIEQICDNLNCFGAMKLYGGMGVVEAEAAVARFQNDPHCRVFVGSVLTSAEGINLTAAAMVVFAELDWRPGKISQAEDRAHRIGQKNSVLVHHLAFSNTIDAYLVENIVRKQTWIDQLTKSTQRTDRQATTAYTELLEAFENWSETGKTDNPRHPKLNEKTAAA